jgi:hypothetical protein
MEGRGIRVVVRYGEGVKRRGGVGWWFGWWGGWMIEGGEVREGEGAASAVRCVAYVGCWVMMARVGGE